MLGNGLAAPSGQARETGDDDGHQADGSLNAVDGIVEASPTSHQGAEADRAAGWPGLAPDPELEHFRS